MADLQYEIKQMIGCISSDGSGWVKEINLISWNNNAPKYDIRAWSSDHDIK